MLPKSVPDPLEPFNRVVWGFNRGVMKGVVKPTSKVYRIIVVKPVRTGIGNIGKNLNYPPRLINNLLQGKWCGARDETYRFVCNTTVGVVGFFDVATKWNIPKSNADFGQTFGLWGWKPACYLMLPILGPSNERDAVGMAADSAVNPLNYVSPYEFEANDPQTYPGPYTYFTYGVLYNNLSDSVDEYVRFSEAEIDPYAQIQYAWTFKRDVREPNFKVMDRRDPGSLETLDSVFFAHKNPEFLRRGKTRSVLIPSTGCKFKFTFWLRAGKAPVVYIVPGFGSHRLTESSLALAELVYKNGYSAVCVSSAFNPEFMEHASTANIPGYLPVDGHDVQIALTEVNRRLNKMYPGRLGKTALLGYSMGALHSLYIAANEPTNQAPLIRFDRYVAVDTPVRLLYGVYKLDEFYKAPLGWPSGQRTDQIKNTLLKVAALSQDEVIPQTPLPFNAIESKFLVGLGFRFTLRDIIYNTQLRHNQGVLKQPLHKYRRSCAYDEILQYSFEDYFEKFAIPYYRAQRSDTWTAQALEKANDLRTYEAGLQANSKIHVLVNQNDFLLQNEDMVWLRSTFPEKQLRVFKQGGHLGNIYDPLVHIAILDALAGLK